jgi:hypothetical protein
VVQTVFASNPEIVGNDVLIKVRDLNDRGDDGNDQASGVDATTGPLPSGLSD